MNASMPNDPVECARRAVPAAGLDAIDLAVGAFGVVLPSCVAPAFLRLARPVGGPIDRARATYLLTANVQLRTATGCWVDGPGLVPDGMAPAEALCREIEAVARAIRLLGDDERFALAYLELHPPAVLVGATAADDTNRQEGVVPDLRNTPTP